MYRDPQLWAQAKQEAQADRTWHTLLGFEGPEEAITAYVLNDFTTHEVVERFDIEELGDEGALKQADRRQREREYEAVRDRYEEMTREASIGGPLI